MSLLLTSTAVLACTSVAPTKTLMASVSGARSGRSDALVADLDDRPRDEGVGGQVFWASYLVAVPAVTAVEAATVASLHGGRRPGLRQEGTDRAEGPGPELVGPLVLAERGRVG